MPKFEAMEDNVRKYSAQEKWLYLLCHAAESDPEHLSQLLGDSALREAVGVLEMIPKTPEDRQFYEARLKFLRDEEARLIAARREAHQEGVWDGLTRGMEQGMEKGKLAGRIQMLQDLPGEAVSSDSDLLSRPTRQLNELIAELRQRMDRR